MTGVRMSLHDETSSRRRRRAARCSRRQDHRRRSLQLLVAIADPTACTRPAAIWLQANGGDAGERVADRDAPGDFELALRHGPVRNSSVERARHRAVTAMSASHSFRSVTFARMRLILASASPRRADLLRAAGIPFDVVPVDIDEHFRPGEKPEHAVARVAEAKALPRCIPSRRRRARRPTRPSSCAARRSAKPADAADAARMLRLLSGRTHEVLTGVLSVPAGTPAGRTSSRPGCAWPS